MRTLRQAPVIVAAVLSSTVACAGHTDARPVPAALTSATAEGRAANGNYALRFGGTGRGDLDRVKIPVDDPGGARTFAADVGATDMTVEFQMRARPGDNSAGPVECGTKDAWIYGNILLDRDRFNQGRKFGLSVADGRVVFGLTGADGAVTSLCSTSRVDDDRWHHVAVTRAVATGAISLFVDGRPEARTPTGPAGDVSYPDAAEPAASCDGGRPCTRSDPFLVIGAEKHDAGAEYPSFRGLVDELRLSTTVRYTDAFAPPQHRFEPDDTTAALYHFDEGGGTVARDVATAAGGVRGDGELRVGEAGPTWVPSDAPTGP